MGYQIKNITIIVIIVLKDEDNLARKFIKQNADLIFKK